MPETKGSTDSVDDEITTAVGLDLGTWNARVATFDTSAANDADGDPVGPVLVHNHDGARATRAAIAVAPSQEPAGDDPEYVPPPPRQLPPLSIVPLLRSAEENDDGQHQADIADFVKNVVLQLACNAAHVPFQQLGVVVSVPALPMEIDDPHDTDPHLKRYTQRLRSILQQNFVGCLLEPVAVCLAYSFSDHPTEDCRRVLVVDLGASGLKVSSLRQLNSNNLWSLDYHTVNSDVSGPHLVDCLGKHVAQQFETKHRFPRGEVWNSKKARQKLQRSGESALTTLLQRSATSTTLHIDGLYEGMDCQVTVSKPRWEMLSNPLASQVKRTIDDVRAKFNDIDQIWLSGPMHAWLQPLIATAVVNKSLLDPSEAVALGCATHAQAVIDASVSAQFARTVTVSPVSIGVETASAIDDDGDNDTIKSLILAGTPLPAMAEYEPDDDEDGKEKREYSIWQTAPNRKKLATIDSSFRLHLSPAGQLSIRANDGECVVIG